MSDISIEPSIYEHAGWTDVTYAYVQSLRAALDAAEARERQAVEALTPTQLDDSGAGDTGGNGGWHLLAYDDAMMGME